MKVLRLLLATALVFQGTAAMAEGLKADTPKIDTSIEKPKSTLQGGVQHSERNTPPATKSKGLFGRASGQNNGKLNARTGAQMGNGSPMRARAADQGLQGAMTSGFGIIGVKFVLTTGRPPIINRVFAGTPAARVGLLTNDVIVAVDGVPTHGLSKEEVYDLIIGSPGTPVTISIMRDGDFRVVHCTRMDINDITDPVVRRDYLMTM